jgi:methylenetetrahydrofolate reductase (NADPH)
VNDLGYTAVPHFASRRLTTRAALEDRIKATTQEAGVHDVLVIGGGLEKHAGDFSSTMEVLETGFFDKYGITHVGVAGHPEGSPDFSEDVALEALRLKKSSASAPAPRFASSPSSASTPRSSSTGLKRLRGHGIDMPVHLGVAGPAKITTLVKYAAMCGVGNSLDFFKKRTRSLATLATSHSPEGVVGPIEKHAGRPDGDQADSRLPLRRHQKVRRVA